MTTTNQRRVSKRQAHQPPNAISHPGKEYEQRGNGSQDEKDLHSSH
jgi:hypothetical protein